MFPDKPKRSQSVKPRSKEKVAISPRVNKSIDRYESPRNMSTIKSPRAVSGQKENIQAVSSQPRVTYDEMKGLFESLKDLLDENSKLMSLEDAKNDEVVNAPRVNAFLNSSVNRSMNATNNVSMLIN
jgi:hypothetical protein